MKRAFLIILLLLAAAVAVWVYFFRAEENKGELVLYGNVDVRLVEIGFRIPGRVAALYFEEGDLVAQGSLMAELDPSPYDSQVRQAAANLNSVKANFNNAEILLRRRQELAPDGGVAQEDLNNATSSYEQLLAQLAAAEQAFAIALDNLSYTKAYAPIDGILLSRVREPGSVVRESDPVYTLSISSPVWIRAFVDEQFLGLVEYGMEAEVSTDNPQGRTYVGRVGFISPMAEFTPKTVETTKLRTDLVYRLRIYVDKPDAGLRQGMPVTVRFKLKRGRDGENG
jgi:HlyD family secretion protein